MLVKSDINGVRIVESRGNNEADFLFSLFDLFFHMKIKHSTSYSINKESLRYKVSITYNREELEELVKKLITKKIINKEVF